MAQASKETTSLTLARARRVLARRRWGVGSSPVASSSASNMPYGAILETLLAGGLTLEFLVEGKDGALRGVVDVAYATAARRKLGRRLWERGDEGGWAGCGAAVGGLGDFEGVACAATTGVGVC